MVYLWFIICTYNHLVLLYYHGPGIILTKLLCTLLSNLPARCSMLVPLYVIQRWVHCDQKWWNTMTLHYYLNVYICIIVSSHSFKKALGKHSLEIITFYEFWKSYIFRINPCQHHFDPMFKIIVHLHFVL